MSSVNVIIMSLVNVWKVEHRKFLGFSILSSKLIQIQWSSSSSTVSCHIHVSQNCSEQISASFRVSIWGWQWCHHLRVENTAYNPRRIYLLLLLLAPSVGGFCLCIK